MRRKDAHNQELESVAQRLRSERPQAGPLELDRIKTSAISRARATSGRGSARRRFAVAGLAVGLMAAGTGGVIAAGGAGHSPGNAAVAQYGVSGSGGRLSGLQTHPTASRIHIRVPRGAKLKTVIVMVNGKAVLVLEGKKASADLAVNLSCGKRATTVVVIAVTDTGRTITERPKVHRCRGLGTRQRPRGAH
jgi:hypothetical protein